MKKILIIGQALPAVPQALPYDTTMLYMWLEECGISKEDAQDIFDFDAVFGSFTGFESNGGHIKPSQEQMDKHWYDVLEKKVNSADKIWILGNVARDYIGSKELDHEKNFLYTIHPSKRNWNLYVKNKASIISKIKKFLNEEV